VLDGVLRRQDQERRLQRPGLPLDRHLLLLHRFQQGRLRLGGGAVDLVAEDHVGEDRALPQHERVRSHVEDVRAGDVRRQEVGVNWIRLKLHPSVRENAFTSVVLATPGTPSTRHVTAPSSAVSSISVVSGEPM